MKCLASFLLLTKHKQVSTCNLFMREVASCDESYQGVGGGPKNSGESSQTKGNGGHGIVDMSNVSMDKH